jgi:hypothetical protein
VTLETIVQLITLATLIAGFAFGAIQVVHYRRHRDREVALELVHQLQTPEFAEATFRIMLVPDGLSRTELEERFGPEGMRHVHILWLTCESLGVLVYRREVTIDMVEDFFSGPITVSWRKLRRYAEEFRADTGRDTMGEWFQWLAERIMEREAVRPAVPANIEHARWSAAR